MQKLGFFFKFTDLFLLVVVVLNVGFVSRSLTFLGESPQIFSRGAHLTFPVLEVLFISKNQKANKACYSEILISLLFGSYTCMLTNERLFLVTTFSSAFFLLLAFFWCMNFPFFISRFYSVTDPTARTSFNLLVYICSQCVTCLSHRST